MRTTSTLIIGAGQAGLALSWHLGQAGHDHVLLERGRVGERWRSERWESLTLLSPNWMNQLPGSPPHEDPDGFLGGAAFADHLEAYARSIGAPIREGEAVRSVERDGRGFRVATSRGRWRAENVVVATGDNDVPFIPTVAGGGPESVLQLHASGYSSPRSLQLGGVLVVGAGPSGQQIALELRRAGYDVVIAVGRHARIPRRYRGADIYHWMAELGELDRITDEISDLAAAKRTPSLPLTGARGGERLDLGVLAEAGVVIAGRLQGFEGSRAVFASDLPANVEQAEERMRRVLARIDEHVERDGRGATTPPETIPAISLPPAPDHVDLDAARVGTIVWATGYRRDYPWLHVPAVLDSRGELRHDHGVTPVPGLYVLGLRLQRTRKSHFIGGVAEDAEVLAGRILNATDPAAAQTSPASCGAPANGKESTMKPATVKSVPLFASVPKRRHEDVSTLADEVVVPAGTELTKQGGYAQEFFIVVSGTADVFRDGRRVASLGPGDFFGEVGLLGARWERTGTVVATSAMHLLVATRRDFQRMIATLPTVAESVLRAAAARR